MGMIRIAVVDDHAVVRAGVRQLVAEQGDLAVVAEAASGRGAVDLLRGHDFDVMLMDAALGKTQSDGVDAMVAVKARRPALPVLIFTAFPETHLAAALLRCGAAGYLNKDCAPHDLMRAIRTVHEGRRYVSADVADLLASESDGGVPPHQRLSERELQVFLHLARGDTIGRLAERMCLSVKTVSTYRTRMLVKLGLETNSEVTYYALKQGLIQ